MSSNFFFSMWNSCTRLLSEAGLKRILVSASEQSRCCWWAIYWPVAQTSGNTFGGEIGRGEDLLPGGVRSLLSRRQENLYEPEYKNEHTSLTSTISRSLLARYWRNKWPHDDHMAVTGLVYVCHMTNLHLPHNFQVQLVPPMAMVPILVRIRWRAEWGKWWQIKAKLSHHSPLTFLLWLKNSLIIRSSSAVSDWSHTRDWQILTNTKKTHPL